MARRATEIDFITGALVREAERLGVPVPLSAAVWRLSKPRRNLDHPMAGDGSRQPVTRVAVIGCGAIGSLFAAHLGTLDDVEMWAFDLNEEHVAAINASGLQLTGIGERRARIAATSDPLSLPPCRFRDRGDEVPAYR